MIIIVHIKFSFVNQKINFYKKKLNTIKNSSIIILSRWTEADVVGKTLYIKVQYK